MSAGHPWKLGTRSWIRRDRVLTQASWARPGGQHLITRVCCSRSRGAATAFQVQCSWVKQVIPDGLGVSWLHELGGMLSPKAGRVTISLVPFLRGRVGSRLLVTVCCVPWVSGAPLFGCMLWRKQSFGAEVSVVNSLGGVDQVAVMHTVPVVSNPPVRLLTPVPR